MSVKVIIGGQFGSEGKGKVAHYWAKKEKCDIAVRVGGSNSGHTVVDDDGLTRIFRHLPTPAILSDTLCVIPAGAYIDVDVLLNEVSEINLDKERLIVDKNAVIVSKQNKDSEQNWGLRPTIGSTGTGTGAAVISRIMRTGTVQLAGSDSRLAPYVANTQGLLRQRIKSGQKVIVEGTQGYGLSLLHSEYYPFTTSRDTTAAAFLSESGLSPFDVEHIVMVLRSFPIRVAGNSGPLPKEISWNEVSRMSGADLIEEKTSVTKQIRRVAQFDPAVVLAALDINYPTQIVMNHLDYVDSNCRILGALTPKASRFVENVEMMLEREIDLVGIGPATLIKTHDVTAEEPALHQPRTQM